MPEEDPGGNVVCVFKKSYRFGVSSERASTFCHTGKHTTKKLEIPEPTGSSESVNSHYVGKLNG